MGKFQQKKIVNLFFVSTNICNTPEREKEIVTSGYLSFNLSFPSGNLVPYEVAFINIIMSLSIQIYEINGNFSYRFLLFFKNGFNFFTHRIRVASTILEMFLITFENNVHRMLINPSFIETEITYDREFLVTSARNGKHSCINFSCSINTSRKNFSQCS